MTDKQIYSKTYSLSYQRLWRLQLQIYSRLNSKLLEQHHQEENNYADNHNFQYLQLLYRLLFE